MQSPVKDARRSDLHLPEFERPNIDLKDLKLPKIDLSDIDMPKVDVGKAVMGAATAVGLAKPRRARWPYLVVAGVAVAALRVDRRLCGARRRRLVDRPGTAVANVDARRHPAGAETFAFQ